LYRRTLEALLPLAEHGAIDLLIPGHGSPAHGDEVLARVRRDLDYLDALSRLAARAIREDVEDVGLDVEAALAFLAQRRAIDRNHVGIFGFSLGGSTAILTAARTGKFAAVAADSAFTNLRDQAREAITGFYHLPSFPFVDLAVLAYELYFQTAVKNIAPESVIGNISPVPLFIIAGEGDEMIPAENGRRLFSAAREPKVLWIIPVGGHGGTISAAGDDYGKRLGEFFDKHLK